MQKALTLNPFSHDWLDYIKRLSQQHKIDPHLECIIVYVHEINMPPSTAKLPISRTIVWLDAPLPLSGSFCVYTQHEKRQQYKGKVTTKPSRDASKYFGPSFFNSFSLLSFHVKVSFKSLFEK